jgi:flavin-dependent dehydrogenase
MHSTEVIVVGGGPAGAACAWMLQKNGVDCIILDRQSFPRNKLCAGWITPAVWRDLMIDPDTYPHSLTEFDHLYVSLKGIHFSAPTRQYAIRRIEFDNWLLQHSGTPVKQHHVRSIVKRDNLYIVDETYQAPIIIGAGGTHCPVYRTLFREISPRNKSDLIVTLEEEFPYPVQDSRCQLWFMEQGLPGYGWYVPKTDDYVNVGVGGKVTVLKKNGDNIKRHWAIVVDKLRKLAIVTDHQYNPKGYSYYIRNLKGKVYIDNAYIIGDAAALASRDMGEGIDVAIKSGIKAAQAIIQGIEYSVKDIRKTTVGYEWLRFPWLQKNNGG